MSYCLNPNYEDDRLFSECTFKTHKHLTMGYKAEYQNPYKLFRKQILGQFGFLVDFNTADFIDDLPLSC